MYTSLVQKLSLNGIGIFGPQSVFATHQKKKMTMEPWKMNSAIYFQFWYHSQFCCKVSTSSPSACSPWGHCFCCSRFAVWHKNLESLWLRGFLSGGTSSRQLDQFHNVDVELGEAQLWSHRTHITSRAYQFRSLGTWFFLSHIRPFEWKVLFRRE